MENFAVKVQNVEYHYRPITFSQNTLYNHQSGGKEYFGRVSMTKNDVVKVLATWFLNHCQQEPKIELEKDDFDYAVLPISSLEQMLDEQTILRKELEEDIDSLKAQITAHPNKSDDLLKQYTAVSKKHQNVVDLINKIDNILDQKYEEDKQNDEVDSLEDTLTKLVIPTEMTEEFNVNNGFSDEILPTEVEAEDALEGQGVALDEPVEMAGVQNIEPMEVQNNEPVLENSVLETMSSIPEPVIEQPVDNVVELNSVADSVLENVESTPKVDMKPLYVDLKQYEVSSYATTQEFKNCMSDIYAGVSKMIQGADEHYMNSFRQTQESMTSEIQNEIIKNKDLRLLVQEKTEETVHLREEIARGKATIQEKSNQIETLNDQISELKKMLDVTDEHTKSLQGLIDEKDVQAKTLEETISSLRSDLANANQLKDAAEAKCEQAESESDVWEKQAVKESRRSETLANRLLKAQEDIKALKANLKDEANDKKRLQAENDEHQKTITKQNATISEQQELIERQTDEARDNQQKSTDRIEYLTGVVDELNRENENLNIKYQTSQATIEKLNEENKNFQTFMSQLAQSPMGEYFKQMMTPQEAEVKTK